MIPKQLDSSHCSPTALWAGRYNAVAGSSFGWQARLKRYIVYLLAVYLNHLLYLQPLTFTLSPNIDQ